MEFQKNLKEYLGNNNIKEVSILGFSLGGFIASEFVSEYCGIIPEIFLVGIRKKYKKYEIEQTIKSFKKNKSESLGKFYSMCILEQKQNLFWKKLFKDYTNDFSLQFLVKTLLYLGEKEIQPEKINHIKKIVLIHGQNDKIAPLNEAIEIKNSLKNAEIKIIKDTGHLVFSQENNSYFYG